MSCPDCWYPTLMYNWPSYCLVCRRKRIKKEEQKTLENSSFEEFVRGEVVEVSSTWAKRERRLYLATIEGYMYPYFCVDSWEEVKFRKWEPFFLSNWTYIRKLPKQEVWPNITRLEVISNTRGREYVKWNTKKVEISMQDEGRTVKIFIEE